MYKVNNKKNISIVAFVFFLLKFIYQFIPAYKVYILIFTAVEAIPFLWFLLDRPRMNNKSLMVLSLGILSIVFSMVAAGENFIPEAIFTVLGVWLGYHLSEQKMDRRWANGLFFIYSVVILIRFLITRSADSIFATAGRNSVSAFLILSAVLVYSSYAEGEHLPIFPAVVAFILSCCAEGRGGVISSALLLMGIVLYETKRIKKISIMHMVVFALALTALLCFVVRYFDAFFGNAIGRLMLEKLTENERVGYNRQYIEYTLMNWKFFLFGVPKHEIPIFDYLSGNFHNSYLSLHSTSGIIGTLIVFGLIAKACFCCVRKKDSIRLMLLLVVLFRMLTDTLCFVALYDPLFFYLIFLCLQREPAKNEAFRRRLPLPAARVSERGACGSAKNPMLE